MDDRVVFGYFFLFFMIAVACVVIAYNFGLFDGGDDASHILVEGVGCYETKGRLVTDYDYRIRLRNGGLLHLPEDTIYTFAWGDCPAGEED